MHWRTLNKFSPDRLDGAMCAGVRGKSAYPGGTAELVNVSSTPPPR
jgi:hypothetical protein